MTTTNQVEKKSKSASKNNEAVEQAEVDDYLRAAEKKTEPEEYFDPREFEADFANVWYNEPFIGTISIAIERRADIKMPTAYIGVEPNTKEVVLGYNPHFFRSLTQKERVGVIRHEMYHLVFRHITDRWPLDKSMMKIFNAAADLAINSIIKEENLPSCALVPGKKFKAPRKDMKELDKKFYEFMEKAPQLQATEWYFKKIKELIEEDKKNGGDGEITVAGTLDDHDAWGKLPQDIRDMIRERMNGLIEKAARRASEKNEWGNIPAEIQEKIRQLYSRQVDWRTVVQSFIGRCRSSKRTSTLKRINKKMPYIFPGSRKLTVANFACFIDQSGSVGDEDIAKFFSELEEMSKETEMDVFHFDVTIDEKSHTKWKKGKKVVAKRTRCGGTDFAAVAEFCNKRQNRGRWSGIICLTDGFAPKMPPVVGARVLWVITSTGDASAARPGDLVVKMDSGTKQPKQV